MTDSNASAKKRLFVGTLLSNEQQELLGKLQTDKLSQAWQRKVRFVKAAKLHMTWVFLGDVEVDAVSEIKQLLESSLAETKSFAVSYNQVEFFSAGHQVRSLVLTPEIISDNLANAASKIRTATDAFATKDNHHDKFRPHITILRIEPGNQAQVTSAEQATIGLELPPWWNIQEALPVKHSIDNVCLIESHFDDGGYRVIAQIDLNRS